MAASTTRDKTYGPKPEVVDASTLNMVQDNIIELYAGKFTGRKRIMPVWSVHGGTAGMVMGISFAWWDIDNGDEALHRIPVGEGDVIDSIDILAYQNGSTNYHADVNVLSAGAGAETTKATSGALASEQTWLWHSIAVAYTMLANEIAYLRINGTANNNDLYAGAVFTYSRV